LYLYLNISVDNGFKTAEANRENVSGYAMTTEQPEQTDKKMKNKMKQTIKFLGLFLLVTVGQIAFGQKQEKIFYNKEWKGCSESKASFYRLVTIDNNGKPIGKVMDYFITGELQSEVEGALIIDKDDDKSLIVKKLKR
jgi:uncharacterized protein YpmB